MRNFGERGSEQEIPGGRLIGESWRTRQGKNVKQDEAGMLTSVTAEHPETLREPFLEQLQHRNTAGKLGPKAFRSTS